MNKDFVKHLALANGFKLKEQPDGSMDLNPYVYEFADQLAEKVEEMAFNRAIDALIAEQRTFTHQLNIGRSEDYEEGYIDSIENAITTLENTQ